jgi:hypothetical protein
MARAPEAMDDRGGIAVLILDLPESRTAVIDGPRAYAPKI